MYVDNAKVVSKLVIHMISISYNYHDLIDPLNLMKTLLAIFSNS